MNIEMFLEGCMDLWKWVGNPITHGLIAYLAFKFGALGLILTLSLFGISFYSYEMLGFTEWSQHAVSGKIIFSFIEIYSTIFGVTFGIFKGLDWDGSYQRIYGRTLVDCISYLNLASIGGFMAIGAVILFLMTAYLFAIGETVAEEKIQRKKRVWFMFFISTLFLLGIVLIGEGNNCTYWR